MRRSYHRACRKAADALQPDRLLILSANRTDMGQGGARTNL
ncbi:hypothetical protein [Streptomyces sp. NPDC101234]